MRRLGLLCALLTLLSGRPALAQAGGTFALDSVRVSYHPFCQWGRCPPYSVILRADGVLTIARDSSHTAIQLADSAVTRLMALVHPVVGSTLPTRIADSRILCDLMRTHQREVIVELYSGAAVRKIVDSNSCQDSGRSSKDAEGLHPIFRNLRLFEVELEALPSVSAWLKRGP